jgi:hypothetical protein
MEGYDFHKDYEVSKHIEIVHAGKFPTPFVKDGEQGNLKFLSLYEFAPINMLTHPSMPPELFSAGPKYTQSCDMKNISGSATSWINCHRIKHNISVDDVVIGVFQIRRKCPVF